MGELHGDGFKVWESFMGTGSKFVRAKFVRKVCTHAVLLLLMTTHPFRPNPTLMA